MNGANIGEKLHVRAQKLWIFVSIFHLQHETLSDTKLIVDQTDIFLTNKP